MKPGKRIAIVGPESTGKTTLALELGRSFNCNVAEEQARDYLSGNLCRCGTYKEVLAAVKELSMR